MSNRFYDENGKLRPVDGLEESTPITEFNYEECVAKSEWEMSREDWTSKRELGFDENPVVGVDPASPHSGMMGAYEDWAMTAPITLPSFDIQIIEWFGMEWSYWEFVLRHLSSECIRAINKRMREGPEWIDELKKSKVYTIRREKLDSS